MQTNGMARLSRLDCYQFKSLLNQQVELQPVTMLLGRNASGKSNVLDSLSLLRHLASARDLSSIEQLSEEGELLRGGLEGAVPAGHSAIKVGCAVELEDGTAEIVVEISPGKDPEIVSELVRWIPPSGSPKTLLETNSSGAKSSGMISAKVYSGANPRDYQFLTSRSCFVQVPTRVPPDSKGRQLVHRVCEQVKNALLGTFILDPVPARMRNYVRQATKFDRHASGLSAALYEMRETSAWNRIEDLLKKLWERPFEALDFSVGVVNGQPIGDVMVTIKEKIGGATLLVGANRMSDGTLRFLAIVAAIFYLEPRKGEDEASALRTLVVEEIENGLHPSQASLVTRLLSDEVRGRNLTLLATTHSPTILDALSPEDHGGIYLCSRENSDGWTQVRRLVDSELYDRAIVNGTLGGVLLAEGLL